MATVARQSSLTLACSVTDNVISLADRRPGRTLEGKAHCIDCRHEWHAVAPAGARWMECPACSGGRGTWCYPVATQEFWQCLCGCDLFTLTKVGPVCCACGAIADSWMGEMR